MLVSHRHQFIYTKTRKTGGTSVESYFEPYCMAEGEWMRSHARDQYVSDAGIIGQRGGGNAQRFRWWNHMPASTIRAQLGEDIWNRYFKFCVVRNPFEKVVSMFYFRRGIGLLRPNPQLTEAEQFQRWVLSTPLPSDREMYLIDDRLCMDMVVRYEQLGQDLGTVCGRLGLPWRPEELPRFKAGHRPASASIQELYSEPARDAVRKAYAFELEAFGYRFG